MRYEGVLVVDIESLVVEPPEPRTKPSLARHFKRSDLDTGFAKTAENSVPSSVID